MKNKRWILACAAVAVCVGALQVIAQEEGEAPAGGMPPEWMKLTDEHKSLSKMVGEWDCDAEFFPAPGMPGMKMKMEVSGKLIMGGRFVEQTVTGQMPMGVFNGRWTMGYDTINKEYRNTWIDDHSPYMYFGTGKVAADGTLEFAGEGPDMMTGKIIKSWSKITWNDADSYTWESFKLDADGKKAMAGRMAYTRKNG